jgi:hypothetical protein
MVYQSVIVDIGSIKRGDNKLLNSQRRRRESFIIIFYNSKSFWPISHTSDDLTYLIKVYLGMHGTNNHLAPEAGTLPGMGVQILLYVGQVYT